MDFFQGSSPPNFISFCLANQIEDESQMQPNNTSNIPGESVPTSVSVDESRVVLGSTSTPAPACPTSLVGQINVTGGVTAACLYPALRLDKLYAALIRFLVLWTVTKQFLVSYFKGLYLLTGGSDVTRGISCDSSVH